jgi:hydrogenase expression/formation protein HypE
MQADPHGRHAAIVGEVIDDPMQLVRMVTSIGGERVIDWLHGEQLPRIC